MKNNFFLIAVLFVLFFSCSEKKKDLKMIDDLFQLRKTGYETLDMDKVLSTYHPDYHHKGQTIENVRKDLKIKFSNDNRFIYEYSNIRFTRTQNTIEARYDLKFSMNIASGNSRGYSQNLPNQAITLCDYQGRLVEIGR